MKTEILRTLTRLIPFSGLRRRCRRRLRSGKALVRKYVPTPADEAPFLLDWAEPEPPRRVPELNAFEKNVFSHTGEDGVVERILSLIGVGEKYAIEFGAWDGKHYSNVFNLVKNHSWKALMIEGSAKKFPDLVKTAAEVDGRIAPVHGCVGIDRYPKLDTYVGECPKKPDILSIDVDGIDYFIWESLESIRPRIVIIEPNLTIPLDVVFVQAKNESVNEGASAAALVELGKKKGYSLAAVTGNLIFVADEEFPKLGIEDNRLETLAPHDRRTRIFSCYNGKIYTLGFSLGWTDEEIRPDTLQYYKNFRWGDGIG